MKLLKVKLINVKSYFPGEEIDLKENIHIFVGPNAGGKSNLFEAIQGVINNLVFRHISIPQNQNWRTTNHPDSSKPFTINFDQSDQNNLTYNILDRHFLHSNEPSTFRMEFIFTEEDIQLVETIIANSDNIKNVLSRSVTNSQGIVDILNKFTEGEIFTEFIGRKLILDVYPHINPNQIELADLSAYTAEEQVKLHKLFELIHYSNVFHELSLITPDIGAYPMIRYFGPQRMLNQPMSPVFVDLSSIGNFEDNYSKSINQNKDNTPSFIDGSFNKLCYLYKSRKNELVNKYKDYLKKYLKIKFTIKRVKEHSLKFVYELNFKRTSGLPMKLSSGEKEFFNLISGLILTGIRNGIVLMDEPEQHLHFQWQQTILDLIEQLSEDFNIQFLIITHSPKFITQQTLPYVHRIYMDKYLTSHDVKPENPLASTELKDLVQFINTTNNEKAFFAHKIILVEGISDLIVYTEIINKIKNENNLDTEIEVIEVGSKNNLIRFRRLLNEWKIENYVIADFDYLKEVRKTSENIITNPDLKAKVIANESEINSLITYSERKLKDLLCKKPGEDSASFVELISKKSHLSPEEFHEKVDRISDYLITERATGVVGPIQMSTNLSFMFDEIAKREGLLILKEGALEKLFPALNTTRENKVKNAIEVSKNIELQDIPAYLSNFINATLR